MWNFSRYSRKEDYMPENVGRRRIARRNIAETSFRESSPHGNGPESDVWVESQLQERGIFLLVADGNARPRSTDPVRMPLAGFALSIVGPPQMNPPGRGGPGRFPIAFITSYSRFEESRFVESGDEWRNSTVPPDLRSKNYYATKEKPGFELRSFLVPPTLAEMTTARFHKISFDEA